MEGQIHNSPPRLINLDILRGLAVLGILYLNIYSMGILEFSYVNFSPVLTSDIVISSFNAFFLDGRFRSLLCLLFGAGLSIQLHLQMQRELPQTSLVKSRIKWLLIFGMIHCTFIWSGDILIIYALSGLFVFKYLLLPAQELLEKGKRFFALGILISIIYSMISSYFLEDVHRHSELYLEYYQLWTGDFMPVLITQCVYTVFTIVSFPTYMFYFGGLIMLGAASYQLGYFQKGLTAEQLKKLLMATILISCADAVCRYLLPYGSDLIAFNLSSISGALMAFIVIHLIAKAYTKHTFVSVRLAQVGKLAFSFYILQSIVMVFIFRYWRSEFLIEFTRLDYLLVALVYTLIQIGIAYLYFKFFNQGPLEALWRGLVNRKRNKFSENQIINTL